jgi:hypothetical protein
MSRTLLILSSSIFLAACSSPRCESADAQSLVTALRPETQFRAMLKMFVERTQTFQMANAKDSSGTRTKLDAALDRAVKRHGAEWERNLVSAWATLNAGELEQVCSVLGEKNNTTFMRFATRVAPAVKSKNEPLLKRAATEILGEIWE